MLIFWECAASIWLLITCEWLILSVCLKCIDEGRLAWNVCAAILIYWSVALEYLWYKLFEDSAPTQTMSTFLVTCFPSFLSLIRCRSTVCCYSLSLSLSPPSSPHHRCCTWRWKMPSSAIFLLLLLLLIKHNQVFCECCTSELLSWNLVYPKQLLFKKRNDCI